MCDGLTGGPMHTDIVDLQKFYYRTPLGSVAKRAIRRALTRLWGRVEGQSIVGVGYPTPFLRPFMDRAERCLALMPAQQGIAHWPREGPNLTALAFEDRLPLPDYSVDRVLLIHALETTDSRRAMMDEVWRVLASGGRLTVVAPNRRGLWARFERTPFGHGYPFSAGQLDRMLKEHDFAPEATGRALFVPPVQSRSLVRTAPAWEQIGQRWFEGFSGVVLIEARKKVYVVNKASERALRFRPVLVPQTLGSPARTAHADRLWPPHGGAPVCTESASHLVMGGGDQRPAARAAR